MRKFKLLKEYEKMISWLQENWKEIDLSYKRELKAKLLFQLQVGGLSAAKDYSIRQVLSLVKKY